MNLPIIMFILAGTAIVGAVIMEFISDYSFAKVILAIIAAALLGCGIKIKEDKK